MSEQILKEVDGSFKSFFSLLKMKKNDNYSSKIKIPHYLDKDAYSTLVIGFVRIVDCICQLNSRHLFSSIFFS